MDVNEIARKLLNGLKPFGPIDWHKSKNGSRYIKFRDVRLGSIRIADHRGRKKYRYTYELNNKSSIVDIQNVIDEVFLKSKQIKNFNHMRYIVFMHGFGYCEVGGFHLYKKAILKKGFI